MKTDEVLPDSAPAELRREYAGRRLRCPLNSQRKCRVYDHRPIGCRLSNVTVADDAVQTIRAALQTLSRNIFLAFTGSFMADAELTFPMVDAVSGRFVQRYFYYLAALEPPK
jgi:Fe-S-cluster containining protein